MEVPGHVNMSRDAVLVTARQREQDNTARMAELQERGLIIDPTILVERRVAALAELLLDTDGLAELELRYQDKLAEWLHSDVVATNLDKLDQLNREARLLAPPGAFMDAASRPTNGRH